MEEGLVYKKDQGIISEIDVLLSESSFYFWALGFQSLHFSCVLAFQWK